MKIAFKTLETTTTINAFLGAVIITSIMFYVITAHSLL